MEIRDYKKLDELRNHGFCPTLNLFDSFCDLSYDDKLYLICAFEDLISDNKLFNENRGDRMRELRFTSQSDFFVDSLLKLCHFNSDIEVPDNESK